MADDSKDAPPQTSEPVTPNVACPHCAAHITRALKVTTVKGEPWTVDVTMLCEQCQKTWIVQKLTSDGSTPPQ